RRREVAADGAVVERHRVAALGEPAHRERNARLPARSAATTLGPRVRDPSGLRLGADADTGRRVAPPRSTVGTHAQPVLLGPAEALGVALTVVGCLPGVAVDAHLHLVDGPAVVAQVPPPRDVLPAR